MKSFVLTAVTLLFFLPSSALGRAPELEAFLKQHSDQLQALASEEETAAYLSTHLLDGYGNVSALLGFIDSLTGGSYAGASDALVQEKILRQYLAGASDSQSRRISSLLSDIRAKKPLTVNINRQMTHLGNVLTAYTLASDIYQALSGQDEARIKALATAINTRIGMLVNQLGTTSLSVAMGGVAFIDYALKTFITAQTEQYHDFWWRAYSGYLNTRYPKMVTGQGSWAALMEKKDGSIQRRLYEFWDDPLENAALYYKLPGPFQRDSLATATFKEKFAAIYYRDYLETTLTTYTARMAQAARSELLSSARTSLNSLGRLLGDVQALKKAVNQYQAGQKTASIPLEVHLENEDGPTMTAPVCNGDILAVTVPENEAPADGSVWIWQVEDDRGIPVEGLFREDKGRDGKRSALFRFQLNRFRPGTYQVRLSRRTGDNSGQEQMGMARFQVVPELIVDKLLATPDQKVQSHHPVITEEQDLFLYAHYRTHRDTDRFTLELSVSRQGSGAVLAQARAIRPREGEKPPYRVGLRLPGNKVAPGDRLVFRFKAVKTTDRNNNILLTASQTLAIIEGQKEKALSESPKLYITPRPQKKLPPAAKTPAAAQKPQTKTSRPEPGGRRLAATPAKPSPPARTSSDSLSVREQEYNKRVARFRTHWKKVWHEADDVIGEVNMVFRQFITELETHYKAGMSRKKWADRREYEAKIRKMPEIRPTIRAYRKKLPPQAWKRLYNQGPKDLVDELYYLYSVGRKVPGFDHIPGPSSPRIQQGLMAADELIQTAADLLQAQYYYARDMLRGDPFGDVKKHKAKIDKLTRKINQLGKAFGAAKTPPAVPSFKQLRAAGKFE